MEAIMNNDKKKEIAVKVPGVKKMYKLGQIGGGTLKAD
jgi:lipopolysaccharide transport system ATP-binding protein